MTQDTSLIGAHMSALLALRERSLQAYGIDPHAIINNAPQELIEIPESRTRALAKISRSSRALAVESDHTLMVV